ncbi:WD40 repeat-containing antisense [Hyphodiscus hymeniophilus]|uniref:WD40 repeat-containing antisense n=1 Tax=Hyphodiscus hymeniophilus TaxID=353542 RepID=A0A9P6VQ03_9HELO|nr:WD40 repeat-containing antisense [Hyphodiscus hymeniophilus]
MESLPKIPALVASTTNTFCFSIDESRRRERVLQDANTYPNYDTATSNSVEDGAESNYFKSAQWQAQTPRLQPHQDIQLTASRTSEGTSLITSSADNTIRTFILPPDLLSSPSSITLTPYTSHASATSINCLTTYPHFSLQDTSTTLYLSTPTDLPIRLQNCLSTSNTPLSTYNLISPTTEAYLTPSSILWSTPGTHFLTGTDCLIALFDVSRNGEGPVSRMPTIPSKRHKIKGGGVGMRGIVSTLSHQPTSAEHGDGMLAAGTWTRWVGLYDRGGLGGMVSTWSIAEAADKDAGIGGTGITQTFWSACGRYLCVVERKSGGVLVYDVRVTGKLVAWLEGREADTNQRLGVDVFEAAGGMEIWAGGTDGVVRVWEEVGKTEGAVERSWEWNAHQDPIGSTVVHNSGTVVATCSGQRSIAEFGSGTDSDTSSSEEEDNEEDNEDSSPNSSIDGDSPAHSFRAPSRVPDNSIKLWSL